MKKIFLMFVAVMGFALAANAQADQCKIEGGNGGYINAEVTESGQMGYDSQPSIYITTSPSKDQPADGKVKCRITYVREDNGNEETDERLLDYKKSGSCRNYVRLDYPAARIKKIEVWGAECKSASRPW